MAKQKIEPQRNRIRYAAAILLVIVLGLISRSGSPLLPQLIKDYAGDTLWALVAYLAIAFIFPRLSIIKVALFAGIFSLLIEVSQLYHADWIDALRQFRLVGLVVGYGFLWSDLVCYFVGIGIGAIFELSSARFRVKNGV